MPTVRADLDACQGYANCVMAADDVFDIDDDGVVVLLRGEVAETERSRVTDAANSCPANALWLED